MYRYIYSSNESEIDIIEIEDRITIDLDIPVIESIYSSIQTASELFPGIDQFRKDIIDVLENEYHFVVIEDIYDGKKQKGHASNRKDSISVYFDTYFDFSNVQDIVKRWKISSLPIPDAGKVHCFIHFRFSDHVIPDDGDVLHRNYLKDNMKKYVDNNPSVTHAIREEVIDLDESTLQRCYSDAIDDLRDALDTRILYWTRRITRLEQIKH